MAHELETSTAKPAQLGKLGPLGMLLGLIGLGGCAFLYLTGDASAKTVTMNGYLYGYVFWMMVSLGFFGITLLHHTIRGYWGLSILRLLEAGGSALTFVVMGILLLPILINAPSIYVWARETTDPILLHKQSGYLNPTFVAIRALVFFAFWAGYAAMMRRSTLRQDRTGDFKEAQRRTNFAAPGLAFLVLSITFAFTDWVMSLMAHWYSTMFGGLFVVGSALAALSLTTFLLCMNADKAEFRNVVTPKLTRDLGNLMLAFTMLWAYFNFSQFLIIWNGNLPATASYYHDRSFGGWNVIGFTLILGQFFIPFMYLLRPAHKRYRLKLAQVAAWIFLMRIVDAWYIVGAMYRKEWMPGAAELFGFLAIGGIWLYVFSTQIKAADIVPSHDPRLVEATH